MPEHKYAFGVIGTGHIATIIVNRLMASEYLTGDRIVVSKSKSLEKHPIDGVVVADKNADIVRNARLVMLSVTPQKFEETAASIKGATPDIPLFVSVMAGMETEHVAACMGDSPVRVIRAMPNLPFGLGCGVTGLYRGEHATLEDMEEVEHLFRAGGVTVEVGEEGLMDAVTAVAGSGPAYFYYFVEMMMAGGVAAGLDRDAAQILAAHACVGAGAMLLEKGASPADLREAVSSPGGTTEAAMTTLRESEVAKHVTEAVLAAFRRSQQLGQLT